MTQRAAHRASDGGGSGEPRTEGDVTPLILDIRDAADLLRISERTIRRLVRRDAIPHFRAGQQIRFVRAELMSWAINRSRQ
jgi:excisionase family DNA binding protein